jgi:hypothetical protein
MGENRMTPFLKISGFIVTLAAVTSFAGSALADDAVVSATEEAPPPLAGRAAEGVRVFLHADQPQATLERRTKVETYSGLPIKDATIAGVATWEPECTAPCNARLDPKYTYRVAGDGLVPSDSFVLPRDGDPLVVDAQMGSAQGRLGGLALTGMGAGGIILGVTALAVTPILAQDDVGSPGVRSGILVSGIALTTLSAFVLGAGLWLWSHNDTRVHPDPMRGIAF